MNVKICGIYKIVHLLSGRTYYGQSMHIKRRWLLHAKDLTKGKHHSSKLQRAWNKYGADAFEFSIVEEVPASQLCEREQFWFDTERPFYNERLDSSPGWRGMKHTDEAKAKISSFRKNSPEVQAQVAAMHAAKRGVPRSEETKAKMRAARTGRRHTPETIEKLRAITAAAGYRHSPETRARMSANRKGKQIPDEAIERMRQKLTGRKLSEEHKRNIASAQLGVPRPRLNKRSTA